MLFFGFLVIAWLILLTVFLWDLIQHGVDKLYMFVIIPLTLFLTITTYVTIQGMLGYPTDRIQEGKFIVLSTAVKEPDWIFYWVAYPDKDEPIAYRFPYTEPEHMRQQELSGKMADGELIQGELTIEDDADFSSKSILGQMEFYTFDYTKVIPKDPPQ
tara:strand:+ start:1665 stop:2138 length:474 start_codon:yes stop_codon:yes gene_type:complete